MKKTFKEFLTEKGITDEDFAKKTAEEMATLYNEFNAESLKAIQDAVQNKASKEDIENLQKSFDDFRLKQMDTIMEALKEQGTAIKSLTEKGGSLDKGTELKQEFEAIKGKVINIAKRVGDDAEVVVKASTLRASVVNNSQAVEDPNIGQLATAQLNAYSFFPKRTITGTNHNGIYRYWDWDVATTVRAAAMVAEGAAFPESTAKWEQFVLPFKKIGDTLPVSEEFFEDEQMFYSELERFLRLNVDIVVNNQIVNGSGSGENLTGLVTSVPAYTPAASGIADASIYDLCVKVSESITVTGGAKYRPNFAMMNIADINKMKLKKDANNNYIIPPFVSRDGANVDGMVVIEENQITANTMVIGDSRFAEILELSGVTVSKGEINAQFTSDMMTLKARKRLLFLIRNVDKTGFRKVTSISAALTTLAS